MPMTWIRSGRGAKASAPSGRLARSVRRSGGFGRYAARCNGNRARRRPRPQAPAGRDGGVARRGMGVGYAGRVRRRLHRSAATRDGLKARKAARLRAINEGRRKAGSVPGRRPHPGVRPNEGGTESLALLSFQRHLRRLLSVVALRAVRLSSRLYHPGGRRSAGVYTLH